MQAIHTECVGKGIPRDAWAACMRQARQPAAYTAIPVACRTVSLVSKPETGVFLIPSFPSSIMPGVNRLRFRSWRSGGRLGPLTKIGKREDCRSAWAGPSPHLGDLTPFDALRYSTICVGNTVIRLELMMHGCKRRNKTRGMTESAGVK